MPQEFEIPTGILNEELWCKHCRKIRARALDLPEGRPGVTETARAMLPLARWTKVDGDPEFQLFRAISSETDDLPVGAVMAYGAPEALEREDLRIRADGTFWNDRAPSAGARLVERYQWTIPGRQSSPGEQ